jgi:CHRD domain
MVCSNEVPAGGSAGKGTAELIGDKMLKSSADTVGAQRSDMRARKYFVNVYTAKFPDGEIRSQLVAK